MRMINIGLDKVSSESDIVKKLDAQDLKIIKFNFDVSTLRGRGRYGYARGYIEAKSLAYYPSLINEYEAKGIEFLILRWAWLINRSQEAYRKHDITVSTTTNGVTVKKLIGLPHAEIAENMKTFANEFLYGLRPADSLYQEFHRIMPFSLGNTLIADLLWRVARTQETEIYPTGPAPMASNIWTEKVSNLVLIDGGRV